MSYETWTWLDLDQAAMRAHNAGSRDELAELLAEMNKRLNEVVKESCERNK